MAIEAVNVKFSYKRKEVYSDLNLNIETPQAYLLLGKNGVGKTTLLKLVSGLLEPLKGKILFNSLAAFPRNPLNLVNLFFIPEEFSLPRLSLAEYSKALSIFYPNFNEADFKKYLSDFDRSKNSIPLVMLESISLIILDISEILPSMALSSDLLTTSIFEAILIF